MCLHQLTDILALHTLHTTHTHTLTPSNYPYTPTVHTTHTYTHRHHTPTPAPTHSLTHTCTLSEEGSAASDGFFPRFFFCLFSPLATPNSAPMPPPSMACNPKAINNDNNNRNHQLTSSAILRPYLPTSWPATPKLLTMILIITNNN